MNRMLITLFALSVIALGGCASNPAHERVDTTKAAETNATLGLRYLQQGNYVVALEKLNKALSFDSRNASAHHYLAELYRRLEKYEEADEHFRDALDYSEGNSSLYNNYAGFLCGRDRYEEGEEMFLRVLENPVYLRKDQVYENLGFCLERKPDLERAEVYLRTALRINPRLPKSLLAMARFSFANEKYMSTRAYLQRYLGLVRHTAETLWLGIRTERILGDSNAVASYGLWLKSNFPDAPETKLYIESAAQ